MSSRAARVLARGEAEGTALVLSDTLSFWGGVDIRTGQIVDRLHPEAGQSVSGTVLVMPSGRGSSSSSAVLAEMMRIGTAPAAIVLGCPDPILTVGAIVAESLYRVRCPIVVCALDGLVTGLRLRVSASDDGGVVTQRTLRSGGR